MERVTVLYTGRVQGVGFRMTVRQLACGFDVTGTVRNLPDGRVELIAEGAKAELKAFPHRHNRERALRLYPEAARDVAKAQGNLQRLFDFAVKCQSRFVEPVGFHHAQKYFGDRVIGPGTDHGIDSTMRAYRRRSHAIDLINPFRYAFCRTKDRETMKAAALLAG